VRDRRFMVVVGLTFLFGTVLQQGSSTLAVDMGAHGLSARQYGLVAAINGVVIVVLQLPVTRALRSRPAAELLGAGGLLMAWGFGLTYLAGSVGLYALTVVVWTLGEIVHAPASMSVVADLAPATARGRYQGMYSVAWSGSAFAGPLVGGLTLDHLGRGAVWSGCALLGTVAALGYYVLLRTRPAPASLPRTRPPAKQRYAATPTTAPDAETVAVPPDTLADADADAADDAAAALADAAETP
jgi:MFS family permease